MKKHRVRTNPYEVPLLVYVYSINDENTVVKPALNCIPHLQHFEQI